jgi:Amt family ammonium transporter
LATGVFADGANIVTQIIGILAIAAFTGVFSFIAWTIIKAVLGMRVEPEEEFNGLDVGEHGMEAYSGFVKESDLIGRSSSTGMGKSSEAIGR